MKKVETVSALIVLFLAVKALAVDVVIATANTNTREQMVVRAQSQTHPIEVRLERVTAPLLGAPYRLSPLGEGPGNLPDEEPTFSLEAFDCTTFVETALALATTKNIDAARRRLNVLRYRNGDVGFSARRHFPEAEWIPELVKLGYVDDVTVEIAGSTHRIVHKKLDSTSWANRKPKILSELPLSRIPFGTVSIPIVPIEDAVVLVDKIPSGTIMSVVRDENSRVPVRVTHQGLVLDIGGQKILRHASAKKARRVVEEPLKSYLLRIQKNKKWPVVGIHLLRVNEPAP